ncbi:MAG: hypothetical protein QXG39_04650 [Candidatus Aenigmatarchaeota archaeon]
MRKIFEKSDENLKKGFDLKWGTSLNLWDEERICFFIKEEIIPDGILEKNEVVLFLPKNKDYFYVLSEENFANAITDLFEIQYLKLPEENLVVFVDRHEEHLISLKFLGKCMLNINFEYFDVLFEGIRVKRKMYVIGEKNEYVQDIFPFLKTLYKNGCVVKIYELCERLAKSEKLVVIEGCDFSYSPEYLNYKTLYRNL